MNPKKRQNIFNLPAEERYGYFVRRVADFQLVWLLQNEEGIATLSGDGDQAKLLPVWPEKEFASLLLTADWQTYRLAEMPLDDFLPWLDELQKEGTHLAAFPTDTRQSIIVKASDMKAHLLRELEQYD